MTKTRWVSAGVAAVVILAALGAGLWFSGGPTARGGWEAVFWAAGITATLALLVSSITWAVSARSSDSPLPSGLDTGSNTANIVKGNVHDSAVVQGRDIRVENASYSGDHIDFRGRTSDRTVIGKQVNYNHPNPGNDGQEPDQ
jgi:hypothetical protein